MAVTFFNFLSILFVDFTQSGHVSLFRIDFTGRADAAPFHSQTIRDSSCLPIHTFVLRMLFIRYDLEKIQIPVYAPDIFRRCFTRCFQQSPKSYV